MLEVLNLFGVAELNLASRNAKLVVDPIGCVATGMETQQLTGRANFEIVRQRCFFYEFLEEFELVWDDLVCVVDVISVEWKNVLGSGAMEIVHEADFSLPLGQEIPEGSRLWL